MNEVIWKAFRLKDIFEPSNQMMISKVKKLLDVTEEKDDDHSIAIVGASGFNNGITGWLNNSQSEGKEISDVITFSYDAAYSGTAFYQKERFVTTQNFGTHGVLLIKNKNLKAILQEETYQFLCKVLIKVFQKNWCYGWNFKIHGETLLREIILLPCLEVAEGKDFFWEENGKHYTLAVEYIKKLMGEAKELREQKTIRLYEAERAKYEAERAKYEAEYEKERERVVWKSFELSDLFDWNSKHKISKSTKEYNDIDHYEDGYVANITAGMYNDGIACYLPEDDEINTKKRINCLTISSNGAGVGACFFHDYYIVSTGDNALLEAKNTSLQKIFDSSKVTSLYFAKLITKLFRNNGIFSWTYKVSKDDFRREIILLPCLETAEGEEFIWEENNKHYTLAVNFISYLYLSGRVNHNQKLIDNYIYKY